MASGGRTPTTGGHAGISEQQSCTRVPSDREVLTSDREVLASVPKVLASVPKVLASVPEVLANDPRSTRK